MDYNFRRPNRMRSICRRVWCRRLSVGKARWRKSVSARRRTLKKLCLKIRCASSNGTRRGRRRSWGFRRKRCWRNCGAWGWRSNDAAKSLTCGEEAGLKPGLYNLLRATAGVEGDGTEGPDAVGDGFVADGAEERGKFGRAEEAGDRVWQVFVGCRLAG